MAGSLLWMSTPLDLIADWPVPAAAAAVVGSTGVIAEYGDTAAPFRLASVTKPLAARAARASVGRAAAYDLRWSDHAAVVVDYDLG